MTQSIYQKLTTRAMLDYEKELAMIPKIIHFADTCKKVVPNGDMSIGIYMNQVNIRLYRYNSKAIWLTAEAIYDALGWKLEDAIEEQSSGYFQLWRSINGKYLIINWYFNVSCKPITTQVTEEKTIGYRCE